MSIMNKIKWIDEEELNEGHINKGQFLEAPKLYVEVDVTNINRSTSGVLLCKILNRAVRIRIRT